MGVQTSRITTAAGGNLSIDPVGETKVKSIVANNPGTTPIACDNTTKAVKKLVITDLAVKSTFDDNDFIVVHNSADGNTVKVTGSDL